MNKELKRKRCEPLHQWVDRLAENHDKYEREELRDVLTELSKISYIEGVRSSIAALHDNFNEF